MKRILVTGAAGQIGSDLVPALRSRYGNENVIAAWHTTPLPDEVKGSGPSASVDVTRYDGIDNVVKKYEIDTLFHLSSILSALAEVEPRRAHQVNINGLVNVLECAASNDIQRVVIPGSIAAFGPETPRTNTPNDTIQKPNTLYGISKVYAELMGNYYFSRLGLDVRGLRLPGIISWKTEPTAGTTDYAVAIFYGAIRHRSYECYLGPETRLPMMYMPDAIEAIVQLAEADVGRLRHHADFNVNSMSFTPNEIAGVITERVPGFKMQYRIDPLRQNIADSWPESLDDSAAREEWGWEPQYDLGSMVDDMLENLRRKLGAGTTGQ